MVRTLSKIFETRTRYRFRTIFGNYIVIRVEDGMYIVEHEEEKPVSEKKYEVYLKEEFKPSQLVQDLLVRMDLEPAEKYHIFKKCTFGIFTAPILDPHVKNININERTCAVTHDVGDLLYAAKYTTPEVEQVRYSLERELEKTCTLTNPILEGSIDFLDYVMRISVTSRGLYIAPMTQISIRKHKRAFYTLIDQVRSGFMSSVLGAILALNWAFPISMSMVVGGVMGSRKTSLLGCLVQFVEPNCIVGIIQDDPELDIRELPGMYIEWHCCRRSSTAGTVKEIKLTDLIRAALRKNYRKIIIAEVRSPDEIYAFLQLLKVTYGAATTIHALSVETLEKRLLSASMDSQRADKFDLEPIRVGVMCGFIDRKPRVMQAWSLDFVHEKHKQLARYERGEWLIREETLQEYIEDLADLNNCPVSEVRQLLYDLTRFIDMLAESDIELDAYTLRNYIVELYKSGLEEVQRELLTALRPIE